MKSSLYCLLRITLAGVLWGVFAHAQTYNELYNFDCVANGCNPTQPALMAQGLDGNLYGTLPLQIFGNGTVITCAIGGVCSTVYNFPSNVSSPQSGLSFGFDGNFYGTTETGGAAHKGTVFKLSNGTVTTLYAFTDGADGGFPWAPPIQAPDGNIYGVTFNGSTPGTAYKITPSGTFSVIANLPSKTMAPLILGTDGKLYGTTQYGGTFNRGTFFQLTTAGKLKILYNFDGLTHGAVPIGPVMQTSDGKFYGTASGGGTFSQGIVYSVTTGGVLKVLHNFQTTTEGSGSSSGLVQGSNTFLYGVMPAGGANGFGTLYKMNTTGTTFTVLYNFDKPTGGTPYATPTLHTNGKIYGVTLTGGSKNSTYGVFYSFDDGLSPFASLVVITSGYVNNAVGIIGQGFSTATGVSVGNGPGQLIPISDTAAAVVPLPGAMTGPIKVHEPIGDLVTPQTFKVLPTISDFTPKSGPVGTVITITGMSLKQTTSVTIGHVVLGPGVFTVVSDTEVTATVPTGVSSPAKVSLKTKGGSAIARGTFTVQ